MYESEFQVGLKRKGKEHAFAADLFGQIKSSLIVLSTSVGMNDSIFHAQLVCSRDVLGADLVRFPSRQDCCLVSRPRLAPAGVKLQISAEGEASGMLNCSGLGGWARV